MSALFSYKFPPQFHSYFDNLIQYQQQYSAANSIEPKVLITFTYDNNTKKSCESISARMLSMFCYHSTSYFVEDKFWNSHFEGVTKVIVHSNVAQPILKLLLINFDDIRKQLEQVVLSTEFSLLTNNEQGVELARNLACILEQRYESNFDVSKSIAAAMLVMLLPLLDDNAEATKKNIHALIRAY